MFDEKLKLKRQTLIATIFALTLFVLSMVAVATPVEAASNIYTPATLNIGGSTLIAPMATDWATLFNTYTGGKVSINYQAVGSTTGTNDMLSNIFSLGYSDAPIPANGLATLNASTGAVVTPANSPPGALAGKDPLIQVVDGLAPIAIFYNIPGYRGNLNLTGDIICQIYLLDITAWNAPQILAINPGLTSAQITDLAKYPISVVHRSDGSGTSFALTTYFGRVDGNWTTDGYIAGSTSSSNFPVGELSAKGTGGVAGLVAATNGAIGYGEVSYAIGGGLVYAAVQNSYGNYVLPLPAGATAAAAADAAILATNPVYSIVDAPGATSYPLSTFTYVFVWANQDLGTSGGGTWTQGLAYDTVQWLYWTVTQGQSYATLLYYAPLPASMVKIDLGLISQINYGGAVILPTSSTSVTCKSSSVIVGKSVYCTAIVSMSGSAPRGSVTWSSTGVGIISHQVCTVPKSGTCSMTFLAQGTSPSVNITALYTGNLNNAPSIASANLAVTQKASKESISCSSGKHIVGSSITCTVKVTGYGPTGTVTWSQSGVGSVTFSTTSCTLTPGLHPGSASVCSVTMTGATAGSVTLQANYGGDSNNLSSSKTKTLTIKS